MAIVPVKNKYQVVIPASVRKRIDIGVGDLLEAKVERGKITFTPKSIVDRRLAEALEDVVRGRTYGPFDTHQAFISSLHANRKKLRAKKSKRSPR